MLRKYSKSRWERLPCPKAITSPIRALVAFWATNTRMGASRPLSKMARGQGGGGLTGTEFFSPRMLAGQEFEDLRNMSY
jgi:hypothetical protein